jgi:hypothetical protein
VGKTDGTGALIPPDLPCPASFQSCAASVSDVTVQDSDAVFNIVNDCTQNIVPSGSSLAQVATAKASAATPAWAIAVLVLLALVIVGATAAAAWKGFHPSTASARASRP